MASTSLTLQDTEQSVSRRIIFDILNQLFEITQITKDIEIRFKGKRNYMQTKGTSIDETPPTGGDHTNIQADAKFASSRMAFIDVQEEDDIDSVQEMMTHACDHAPVFFDTDLDLYLFPVYANTQVEMRVIFRSPSETEAKRWISEILSRVSRGRDLNLHDISYTYSIPFPFVRLIEDVWTLREANEGYGQSLSEYVALKASERLTMLSNRASEERMLSVKEKQSRIIGLFSFAVIPDKPEWSQENTAWEISFSYRFKYQKPIQMYCRFPLSVHNQLLPDRYLDVQNPVVDYDHKQGYYSRSYAALSIHELNRPLIYRDAGQPSTHLTIPDFDDFNVEFPDPLYMTCFTILVLLDEDRRTLFNLKDLDEYQINPGILEFLHVEYPWITTKHISLFHLSLYDGDEEQPDGCLEVLPDLTVRAKTPLSMRKRYHVRMSIASDLRSCLKPSMDRLGCFPRAFVEILSATNSLLRTTPGFIRLNEKARIEPWELYPIQKLYDAAFSPSSGCLEHADQRWLKEFQDLFDVDDRSLQEFLSIQRMGMRTVQTSYIVARKLGEKPQTA